MRTETFIELLRHHQNLRGNGTPALEPFIPRCVKSITTRAAFEARASNLPRSGKIGEVVEKQRRFLTETPPHDEIGQIMEIIEGNCREYVTYILQAIREVDPMSENVSDWLILFCTMGRHSFDEAICACALTKAEEIAREWRGVAIAA